MSIPQVDELLTSISAYPTDGFEDLIQSVVSLSFFLTDTSQSSNSNPSHETLSGKLNTLGTRLIMAIFNVYFIRNSFIARIITLSDALSCSKYLYV